jgi:tRNA pseudouridine38-40 synthase
VVRWRLDVEYDGRAFAGWQVQPSARTVQGALEAAIEAVFLSPARIHGAGRTDAGVSARQQVAIFDHGVERPAKAVLHGLNHYLPDDVVVLSARPVPATFHPRHSPHHKVYRYTWLVRPARPVLDRGRCWYTRGPLDGEAMAAAVVALQGTHDMTSFRAAGCSAAHAVRTILDASVVTRGPRVELRLVGTGFLRHQVRIVAGTLMEIGLGRRPPDHLQGVLEAQDRSRAGRTAPAEGLLLERIVYDGEV